MVNGPKMAEKPLLRFPDPQCIHKGANAYLVEGKTIYVRPQVSLVVRTLGANGNPIYKETVEWIPDPEIDKINEAMTRPSTISRIGGDRDKLLTAVKQQKSTLEWLFRLAYQKDWFADKGNEKHPAWIEWNACNQLIRWGGFKPDDVEFEYMRMAAKVSLDSLLLVSLSEGNMLEMIPGPADAIGNDTVLTRIKSRIGDPESFESLFVELYTAAWHKTKGRKVQMMDKDGYPDLKIVDQKLPFPVFLECKRLSGARESRIGKDINKASIQIGHAVHGPDSDAYGAVLLDFTPALGAWNDKINREPDLIVGAIKEVERALSGTKNSHVRTAIVVWDDFKVQGELPQPVVVHFNRRARLIHHEGSRLKLPIDNLFDGMASRIMFRLVPDEKK